MERPNTESVLKFVKNTSQSSSHWSIIDSKGMIKDVLKDKFYDKTKASRKSPTKENTRPKEFKLHTQERAVKRAIFNYEVTTKLYLMELQKRQEEKLMKMIEEEEIRVLRKDMVPRAQLMPYFDKPFSPNRSSRTVPRESCIHMMSSKCWSCAFGNGFYNIDQCGHQTLNNSIG
ncbi:uncharacterized protein [Medicago truncatula]|uniref:uncharacterized protein isoform X2 n=1 Tax=Medicago truncatula TaxID=3880 RepID=UPI00196714A2|nr:uncharacterized protein LOC25493397 isoform X2 [Medicago truncatula]